MTWAEWPSEIYHPVSQRIRVGHQSCLEVGTNATPPCLLQGTTHIPFALPPWRYMGVGWEFWETNQTNWKGCNISIFCFPKKLSIVIYRKFYQETMMIEYDGAFGISNSHLALIISASLDILQCVFGSWAETLQLPVARKIDSRLGCTRLQVSVWRLIKDPQAKLIVDLTLLRDSKKADEKFPWFGLGHGRFSAVLKSQSRISKWYQWMCFDKKRTVAISYVHLNHCFIAVPIDLGLLLASFFGNSHWGYRM